MDFHFLDLGLKSAPGSPYIYYWTAYQTLPKGFGMLISTKRIKSFSNRIHSNRKICSRTKKYEMQSTSLLLKSFLDLQSSSFSPPTLLHFYQIADLLLVQIGRRLSNDSTGSVFMLVWHFIFAICRSSTEKQPLKHIPSSIIFGLTIFEMHIFRFVTSRKFM